MYGQLRGQVDFRIIGEGCLELFDGVGVELGRFRLGGWLRIVDGLSFGHDFDD